MNQRIKRIRDSIGQTQEVFAKTLDTSREIIAKVETGVSEPSLELVTKIHNKLGINLNWLIADSGKMKLNENNNVSYVHEPEADYGLKAAFEAQRELLKYKDEENKRLKEENARLAKECEEFTKANVKI